MYKLPEGSKQTQKILSIFTNKNKNKNAALHSAKGKENKDNNVNQEDTFEAIENSRKEFAAEYLAKYGDADIERRAIPISNYPSIVSTSIKQIEFNPDIYTDEYNCDKFYTILENYNQNKNDVNKLKLKTLLTDGDCLRIIDTIGKNKNDPSNWNIPDGQFRSLLNELNIVEPYNANIKNIIQTRKNVKHPVLRKFTAGERERKRKRERKGIRRSTKRKQRRNGQKSRKYYKK